MTRGFLFMLMAVAVLTVVAESCSKENGTIEESVEQNKTEEFGPEALARMFADLPLEAEHLEEVHCAANASSENGFDEEYMLKDLMNSPGAGVGDNPYVKSTRAGKFERPLRDLISEYLSKKYPGAKGGESAEALLQSLSESGYQLYWPYSEDWDGKTFPIITFDPGLGAETNYGFEIRYENGRKVVDSVLVTEALAMERPVWVVNTNNDSAFTPLELIEKTKLLLPERQPRSISSRMLMLKSFTMLRNYDSWFGGGSEFFLKCGSVNGFTASTEAELKLYSPSVTDMMIVIKRKYKGKAVDFNSIIMTSFTNQLDQLVFLITEDDGGTVTSWKCSAVVKIASKSYGFDVDIPYRDKDDIVWRGQLSASFFQSEDIVKGRFGDVEVSFALE